MGKRLAWYDSQGARPEPPVRQSPADGSHIDAARFVEALRTPAAAIAPSEILDRQGAGLRGPGLYSWWVDEAGADDLTDGLELPVSAGLVYAGLAGATRWPSGRRSGNTLWSRISGMHLGSRHEFSTFRRTLGAVLANAAGTDSIDEVALTAWMHRHLKVVAVPYDDADTLGRLEEDVLKALDPPLNLKGMTPTPVRLRLTELRRRHR
jgi:hypothetical protein